MTIPEEMVGSGSGVLMPTTGHGDVEMTAPRKPRKFMVITTLESTPDNAWSVLSTKTTVLEWQPSK
jgi:hypothetical protein